MAIKREWHPDRQRAINAVWLYGLTNSQRRIVNVLDACIEQLPDEISIPMVRDLTGLSYGTIWIDIGVLAEFGYITIVTGGDGRMGYRGIRFNFGFDLSEGE